MNFYQILSTNSLSKCMEISLKNLSVDIGSLKAQHTCFHSPYCKLQILILFLLIYGQHVHARAINC